MNFDFVVLALSSIFNITLSVFIFLRNSKHRTNQVFGLFGVSVVLWTIFNFAADHAQNHNLLYTRLTLFFGAGVVTSLFALCTLFPLPKTPKRSWRVFYLFSAVTSLLCLTPFFVQSVTRTSHGAQLTVGSLYSLFSLYILAAIIWSLRVVNNETKKLTVNETSQVKFFTVGILIYTTFAFLSNVVLPIIVNNWSSSRFGPIFSVPFVTIMGYAIVKHRLFDIRLALARTIGFVVTISVVAGIYSLAIVGILAPLITKVKSGHHLELLLFVPPTIFVALTFHSLQQYIARLTRSIFYQDSYDLRSTLDKLSDALITDNNMNKIMSSSLTVISEAIRPSYAVFIVVDDRGQVYHQRAINHSGKIDLEILLKEAQNFKRRVVVKDELASGPLLEKLEQANVALLLKLGTAKNLLGIVAFGPKQSGQTYARQDIDLLTISAKNLGVAIENAKKYEQIAAFADTMHKEVLRATSSLRRANEELKTLDSLKDDFISMASHQLRSPATSVHEAIQMLAQTNLTRTERQRLLELAEASSERLVGVITDMLSIARIQAGHFDIEKTYLNMEELADRAILEASGLAAQSKITVQFKRPDQTINLYADRSKLNESMSNFIENAIRYSPSNSTVIIELKSGDDKVRFEVGDSGIGVPPAERKNLFSKFYRASNARSEHPNGNGIGLFVVKTIAQNHGGDAYYKPLETGSLFGFWIPLK